MCSIGDEYMEDGESSDMTPQTQAVLPTLVGVCHKCGQDGEMYKLDFREPECEKCFLQYVNHKFRAALGSSKSLPRNADILLVFDGSAQSIVLLDMLQKAQSETNFKKLHCDFKILFIDDHEFIENGQIENYRKYIQQVQALILSYKGRKSYIINLRSDKNQRPFEFENLDLYLSRNTDEEKIFANNVNIIRTSTSRNEYIKLHRKNLIGSLAYYLNCNFVFVPSINKSIAIDLLSAIVLGHGNNAALDVALIDDRLGNNVKLMRPIKDLSESEILLYLRARNLKTPKTPDEYQTFNCENSLQTVTEFFIQNLQRNFNSTVSTIFRIGNKIATNIPKSKEFTDKPDNAIDICRYCNSLISVESKTILAVNYSRYVSEEGPSPNNSLSDMKEFSEFKSQQRDGLCHSCTNIQSDCDEKSMQLL